MKLAEVATSPEFWDPDKHPPKSEEAKEQEEAKEKKRENGGQQCNGHSAEAGDGDGDERGDDAIPQVVVGNGDGGGDKEAAAAVANPMNVDLTPPQLPSQAGKVVVDPVTEVVPDMEVKIADLGNACWVVSWRLSF